MHDFEPGYQRLLATGELAARAQQALSILSSCTLCPRSCGVNRLQEERGYCGAADDLMIASVGPHFGEEPPLSGNHGAGTIFFTHCSLKCCYCQNHQISHEGVGKCFSVEDLSRAMLRLQDQGCHNIDLVTAGHFIPFVLQALIPAAERGLHIPLVYNCSGYETLETLRLMDGIIDIYLPDWKYGDDAVSADYSQAPDYPTVCERALKEMYRQVGDLQVDDHGIAQKGLIVRHLVLPHHLDNTAQVLSRLARILPETVRISLMAQYAPRFHAHYHDNLQHSLSAEDYEKAMDLLDDCGFLEYWVQELDSSTCYFPDFNQENPFHRT